MPVQKEIQKRGQNEQTQTSIKKRLTNAGIKVRTGKKMANNGKYSGVIGNNKKVLELKF